MSRVVFFVDLDYFFAQVEVVQNPSLREKPVVVCVFSGRTKDSGVVSSANYVARSFGVKAGMPIKKARAMLPPDSVFLPVRLNYYAEVSRKIMDILRSFGGVLRVESIDEAVMDVTEIVDGDFEKALTLASEVKRRIFELTGLTCTVGVGPNRVVAKMVADVSKPDGLQVVRPHEVADFLKPLPVKSLPGVGAKTEQVLADMRIKTVGELSTLSVEALEKLFGPKKALYLYHACRGTFDEPIVERPPAKQVSRIITLKRNTREVNYVMDALAKVLTEAAAKLESMGYTASKLGLIVITSTIKTVTRQTEIRPGAGLAENLEALRKMLKELLESNEKMHVRRVGVRFSGLKKLSGQSRLNVFMES
ncbi:MAG: DNA polymerase IV [Candidatus Caldarchaeum sp.]|nr:DNA polymerase IV [Candidatus Caldarchaeum sp.]